MGMIGLVVVGDDTSNKDKIAKAKALGKSKKKLKKLLSELWFADSHRFAQKRTKLEQMTLISPWFIRVFFGLDNVFRTWYKCIVIMRKEVKNVKSR